MQKANPPANTLSIRFRRNSRQSLVITGLTGTFKLTVDGAPAITAAINYNPANTVQSALKIQEALKAQSVDSYVRYDGANYQITFLGQRSGAAVQLTTANNFAVGVTGVAVTNRVTGGSVLETYTLTRNVPMGSFTLKLGDYQITGTIAANAVADTIRAQLALVVGEGNVLCAGADVVTITFQNDVGAKVYGASMVLAQSGDVALSGVVLARTQAGLRDTLAVGWNTLMSTLFTADLFDEYAAVLKVMTTSATCTFNAEPARTIFFDKTWTLSEFRQYLVDGDIPLPQAVTLPHRAITAVASDTGNLVGDTKTLQMLGVVHASALTITTA